MQAPVFARTLFGKSETAVADAVLALVDEADIGDDLAIEGKSGLVDRCNHAIEADITFLGLLAPSKMPGAVHILYLGTAGILEGAGSQPLQGEGMLAEQLCRGARIADLRIGNGWRVPD